MRYVSRFLPVVLCAVIGGLLLSAGIAAAQAEGDSPWLVRARVLSIVPDDESSAITVIGGNAEVDDSVTVELDISYFLANNVALELILGVARHDVEAVGTSVGAIDLGDVVLLPPMLSLQYHIAPDSACRPYVGAGINFTHFFEEDPGAADGISYDDNFGFSLQAGLDYDIDESWTVNIDVKKLFLSTDVDVNALGTTVSTEVDIDPWVFGLGLVLRL